MVKRLLFGTALAVVAAGCGSSDDSECEQACETIEQACSSTTSDCVSECSDDVDRCADEMDALFACIATSELRCDPGQDQGLAEAPCQTEHDAVNACGADPF